MDIKGSSQQGKKHIFYIKLITFKKVWAFNRLILNEAVTKQLFVNGKLHYLQNDTVVNFEVEVESVEVLLLPLGSASIIFNINWLPAHRK
jgi:hypothetical protein